MSTLINSIVLCFVLVITTACIIRIWRNVDRCSNHVHIHVVLMSFNTVTGMAIGTTFAMFFHHNMLAAVLVGLLIGYLTGRPLGMFAIVDGLTSGLMGSLMGLMVAPMTQINYTWIVIEVVFVLLMLANHQLLGQIAGGIEGNKKAKLQTGLPKRQM